jgi:hypothetical protein
MTAKQHTRRMLLWLEAVGVERLDLALRHSDATMIWHRSKTFDRLPLSWARALNVRQAEVYIRPARGESWPLVFLDDVALSLAVAVTRKYAALAVATSPHGGCHLWLACRQSLSESKRAQAQRWLARRTGADRASTSGEHLGRLAGFRNWKRSGVWVNTVASSVIRSWNPAPALRERVATARSRSVNVARRGTDTSPSGQDWAWACCLLESGHDPHSVYHRLVARARPRRGADAERYARRTVDQAIDQLPGSESRFRGWRRHLRPGNMSP